MMLVNVFCAFLAMSYELLARSYTTIGKEFNTSRRPDSVLDNFSMRVIAGI